MSKVASSKLEKTQSNIEISTTKLPRGHRRRSEMEPVHNKVQRFCRTTQTKDFGNSCMSNRASGSGMSGRFLEFLNVTCSRPKCFQIILVVSVSHFTLYTLGSSYWSELVENIELKEYRPFLQSTIENRQMPRALRSPIVFHC